MARKKVVVIYQTAGGGHQANALAVEAAIRERHGEEIDVFLLHIAQELQSQRVKALYEAYNLMLKSNPRMVKVGFRLINMLDPEAILLPLLPKVRHNLEACIRREKPDLILSVFSVINHTAINLLKRMGWYGRVPYLIFCTDLSHGFLRQWVDSRATAMIALSKEAADQMIQFGYPAQRIRILNGLPVNPVFTKLQIGRVEARQQLQLMPEHFTILITMGGVAVKNTWRFARDLAASGMAIQIVVVCGRNRLLERRARRIAARSPVPMRIFGFTDQMPLLMEAADVVITKPGPGTIAEAIAKRRPLLVDAIKEPMPQEKGNLDYISHHGIGDAIERRSDLVKLIRRYMEDKPRYDAVVENMGKLGNSQAVYDLADYIVSQIPESANKATLAQA
ncbi:MAG: hypothetical protein HY692_06370 [Cyanobacteria bacterium NC_groundwater_1444_Ag_S-0.65um_54_12]|nr:hypothetical protein [Cyanobacteria bacterium NC_groundwater_1444_Ag_S-0.65um_54_12]